MPGPRSAIAQLVHDKSMRSILDHATLVTDGQIERLMKSNPVADGDDGKQFGTQCIGARDIVGIKLSDSGSILRS